MRLLTTLALLLNSGNLLAEIDLSNLSRYYLQTVQMPSSPVVYGNPTYGFFATDACKASGKRPLLTCQVLPPGYELPVSFFVKRGERWKFVNKIQFQRKDPELFHQKKMITEKRLISHPFVLVTSSFLKGQLRDKDYATSEKQVWKKNKYRFTFLALLNRLGEIIWAHAPTRKGAPFSTYISATRLPSGDFGLVLGKKAGFYQEVGIDGSVTRQLDSRHSARPFTMHHDFAKISPTRMLTISTMRHPKHGYLEDRLILADIGKQDHTELYRFTDMFTPENTSYYTGDDDDDKKFVTWDAKKATFDFTHANTVTRIPGGLYLVALRNLDKVLAFDLKARRPIWTLGHSRSDTFFIAQPSERFHHLHTPDLTPEGHLSIFDNDYKTRSSRLIIYKLETDSKEAVAIWQYRPKQPHFSKDRSSATRLGDSWYIYFVNPTVSGKMEERPRDVLHEVSAQSGKLLTIAVFPHNTLSPGYRLTPMTSVGQEKFLGYQLPIE